MKTYTATVKEKQADGTWKNVTVEFTDDRTRRKGKIFEEDVKEYNLPSGEVEMVECGEWTTARGNIKAWTFADGREELGYQFSKDRHNIFYLEAIN